MGYGGECWEWCGRRMPNGYGRHWLGRDAWQFIHQMKEEWTEQDWSDFYSAVDGALKKIAQRHQSKEEPVVKLIWPKKEPYYPGS